jgi:hypothetical protein
MGPNPTTEAKMKKKTKIKRGIVKRMFGNCRTCGQPNDPRHTCNIKFSRTNADRLRKRMGE